VSLLCLSACKQSLPPDIWEKEKMIEFLVDAQLLEAKVSIEELPKKQSDSLYACYYEELFAYHNTTREIWLKNMKYYRDRPEEMDDIYKEIISRLTLLETTKVNEQQKLQLQDSLKRKKDFKIRDFKPHE
jgi:hypothetical protein